MSNEYNIEEDKQIDPDALDVEWLQQPDLYYKYSEALDQAMNRRNEAKVHVERQKENLDRVKGEVDLEIRNNPEDFDLPKITDATVSAAVVLDERYEQAVEDYFTAKDELNEAQKEVNEFFTCVNTMEQRKAALSNLAYLLNQQYFSTPSEPRNLGAEYRKKVNKNSRGARNKVKERRRKNHD
jgi:hypothetical protein